MKKVIIILLLLPIVAISQSFNVFDINTSEYPIMKAKFYSIDENDDQILNHTTSDFEIIENGNPAEVLSVSCPEPLPIPISVGIMVDTYSRINLARHGAERFVNFLNMPQNELGITYMDGRSLLFLDFTKDKSKAQNSSKQIPPAPGGTSVSEMFFDKYAGGIELIKNREAQNRVLIFVSDLHCPNLSVDEQELIQQAKDNNIRIYTVLLNTSDYTGLFTRIADNTNGNVFESVRDSSEIEDIFEGIVFREQNDPCEISWNSNLTCGKTIDLEILNKKQNLKTKQTRRLNESQYLSFKINPFIFDFGTSSTDTTITITANNGTQIINDIVFDPDYGDYKIATTLPVTIPTNGSIEIELSYTAKDDSREYTRMEILGDYCTTIIGLLKGDKNKPLTRKTLELAHPNGGEVFIAGVDTIITWEGISEKEKVNLRFSSNNGKNWSYITNTASNLSSSWKVPVQESDSCLVGITHHASQKIGGDIIWSKTYGGSDFEFINTTIASLDGGIIAVGLSHSSDIFLNTKTNKGNGDFLILKLNDYGMLEWSKTYGGSENDILNSINSIRNGGYLCIGRYESSDGDFQSFGNKGANDICIMKVDNFGDLIWKTTFGGSSQDIVTSSIETDEGDFLITGYTASNDGDFDKFDFNNNEWNMFVIKLNRLGEKVWIKSYGGSRSELPKSIINSNDSNYVIAVESSSIDGDLLEAKKLNNGGVWILKINFNGDILKSEVIEGTLNFQIKDLLKTENGEFLISGYIYSNKFAVLGGKSSTDIFIIRIDSNLSKRWINLYGGTSFEDKPSIVETKNKSFIIACHSDSDDFDLKDKVNISSKDIWIFKIDDKGDIKWSKIIGGKAEELASSSLLEMNGRYFFGGNSHYTDGNFKSDTINNSKDAWFFEFLDNPQPLQSDTSDAVFSIIMPEPVIQNNDIDMGQMIVGNTKDTIVSSVICNTGDAPLHVLGVDITGGDDIDFLIPRGAGDFYLEKDECQDMMFEFTPSALGNRTAVATIRTTIGDFTDTISIRGVGIDSLIEATTDVVDFGKFELGDGKDTTVVLIRNLGAEDITITETKITGPDMEQFDMVPLPTFTLTSGDDKELELKYTAKYGGRTSSIIEFYYDGVGSPLRSMLFAEGIGGEVYPQVPDAYVGERVELGLHLGRIKPEGLDEVATNFTATVSYNSTLLAPIDKNMTVTTENTTSFIEIEGQLSGVSQIATVPMKVGLGTAVSSGLVVTEFQLYNATGDSVDYEIEPGVGEFNILGICEDGGTRLINPNGEQVEMIVSQDQMNTNATVSINLIESGQTDLIIYDQLGNAVETAYSGTPSAGSKELNIDLSNFANGRYYIKLTTPTITKTEIIEIVR